MDQHDAHVEAVRFCMYGEKKMTSGIAAPDDSLVEVGRTSRDYAIFRKPNGVGGYDYWSDEIGGGVHVWNTCLVGEETLEACIAIERVERAMDRDRFAILSDDPPAVLPEGFAAPLSMKTTRERTQEALAEFTAQQEPLGAEFSEIWDRNVHLLYEDSDPLDKTERGQFPSTDDASATVVLSVLRCCALLWQPEARIVGNIRAGDIAIATDVALNQSTRIAALEAERDAVRTEVRRLRKVLEKIATAETEVWDSDLNCSAVVSVDPDELSAIARAALAGKEGV